MFRRFDFKFRDDTGITPERKLPVIFLIIAVTILIFELVIDMLFKGLSVLELHLAASFFSSIIITIAWLSVSKKQRESFERLIEKTNSLEKSTDNLTIINRLISDLLRMKDLPSICKYITDSLKERYQDTIVLYVSVLPERKETRIDSISCSKEDLDNLKHDWGNNPVGKITGYGFVQKSDYPTENLSEIRGSLTRKSRLEHYILERFRTIPGIHKIYSIGIYHDNTITGAVIFLAREGCILQDPGFIEAYIKHAGVVLNKRSAELALIKSEEKYRGIIEKLPDTYYRADKDGKILIASPSCLKILGFSKMDEVLGLSLKTLYPSPNDRAEFVELLKRTGSVTNHRTKLIRKDGSEVFVETNSTILLDEDGEYIGVEGIVRDISERMRMENALAESEQKFRQAFDFASIGIALVDLDGSFMRVNRSVLEMFGYSEAEIYPKTLQELTYSEDKEADLKLKDELLKGERESYQTEKRYLHKDGTVIWCILSVSLVSEASGKPGYFITQLVNISGLKQAELILTEAKEKAEESERKSKQTEAILKEAQKTAQLGYWWLDIKNNGLVWSDEVFNIFECDPSSFKATYEAFLEMVHPDDREKVDSAYRNSLQTKQDYEIEHRILTRNRNIKYVLEECKTEFDGEGKPVSSFGIVLDISKRKKTESELYEAKERAEASARTLQVNNIAKDKLLSIIAHDLQSPLNGVLGLSELLHGNTKVYSAEKNELFLSEIVTTVRNTLSLLDNLLKWARIRNNVFKPEQLYLKDIVCEVFNTLAASAKAKGITLNYFEPEHYEVVADVNMLNTVIRNLVQNAIKYVNHGGRIDVYPVMLHDKIEVNVSDNGIGMSEEIRSKLFSPDSSETLSGTAGERGSGLGLVLCREFVERHGGEISVDSTAGKGSTFTFTLPRQP